MQKGGYIIISINDIDIYNKLQVAMKINKPILFYEDTDVCYFIDTISGGEVTSEIIDDEEVFTYHDIIMKKGSKTFTITSANAVSSEGEIQLTPDNFYPLLENIKDASGNLRFIEGDGVFSTGVEGITCDYSKWSLSGTHLMVVALISFENGTTASWGNSIAVDFTLPNWIHNKIYSTGNNIDSKQFIAYDSNDQSQNIAVVFRKASSDKVNLRVTGSTTLTSDKVCRIQFDLLIDNESEE